MKRTGVIAGIATVLAVAAVAVVAVLLTWFRSDENVECSGRAYSGGHPAVVYGQGLTSRATATPTTQPDGRPAQRAITLGVGRSEQLAGRAADYTVVGPAGVVELADREVAAASDGCRITQTDRYVEVTGRSPGVVAVAGVVVTVV
ncbi:hypothetical protein [Tsukamurella hominis]|uniref:hypothetical protein n=1 Tax=Tsukamurella hominis TaxID=1970232 RepID=UPI0039E926D7